MTSKNPVRSARNLTFSVIALVVCAIGAQQLIAEKSTDKQTAEKVVRMLSTYHISQKPVDDEISKQLFKRYIDNVDSQKNYLFQNDIDGFDPYRTELDDLLRVGDVEFAYSVFKLYLQRLDERVDAVHALIDADYDFTIDESVVFDGDELDWCKTPAEMHERWRKRIKYDLLSLKLDGTEPAKARERLHKRYRLLKNTMHQTEDFEIFEMYLTTLATCFDPHSQYMSPQTLDEFRIHMKLQLQGIGAQLTSEDGMTTINRVMPGGAAEKDGRLKKGDRIVAVAQKEGDFVDVVEMKLSKVVRYIRGPEGTIVRLKVIPKGQSDEVVYELTRQKVELQEEAVSGKIIDGSKWFPGSTGRIGVINIPSFYRDFAGAEQGVDNFRSTARDVLAELDKFRDAGGVDAVVVDLRWDGGGSLAEAVEVSGLFNGPGPVVQIKQENGDVRLQEFDGYDKPAYTGPLVVVVNRLSASASEIFAGAVADYDRGLIVGDSSTYGKGSVQNVVDVLPRFNPYAKPLGALKVTVSQFYRPNGDSTQNEGVKSNIVLPSRLDHMDQGERFQDNALAFDHIDPVQHTDFGLVTPALVQTLRQASKERIAASSDFAKIQAKIDRYVARKNRKSIPLKEDVLRKEREEGKSDEDEDLSGESEDAEKKDIFEDDAYNRELAHIALDYAQRIASRITAGK